MHSLLPPGCIYTQLSSGPVRAAAQAVAMAGGGGGLPPGYRFYPTEEELICFYLRNKLDSLRGDMERVIPVVDVYSVDPWQLPFPFPIPAGGGGDQRQEEPWFYFCPRQEREARGGRPSRTTPSGYWKAAGTPGLVYSAATGDRRRAIGVKKTMVFYRGRAPAGSKTKWKMNEYRALLQYEPPCTGVVGIGGTGDDASSSAAQHYNAAVTVPPSPDVAPQPQLRSEFSLCRLYTRSGSLRQFDRRPLAAAPPSSTAAVDVSPPDDDDRDGSGSSSSMQQQQQQLTTTTERGANDPCADGMVTTAERDGAHDHDPFADDVVMLDALLYWPGD